MAYNELIKNFERVRSYLREVYVYGFRSREEFNNSLLCAGQGIPAGLSLQRRRDTTAAAGPAFFQGLSL